MFKILGSKTIADIPTRLRSIGDLSLPMKDTTDFTDHTDFTDWLIAS